MGKSLDEIYQKILEEKEEQKRLKEERDKKDKELADKLHHHQRKFFNYILNIDAGGLAPTDED